MPISSDSTSRIRQRLGAISETKPAAAIQPAVPPPRITISSG